MRGPRAGGGGGGGGPLATLRRHHAPPGSSPNNISSTTTTTGLRCSMTAGPRLSVDSSDAGSEAVQSFHKAALYVFGEKTQIKVKEECGNVLFKNAEAVVIDG